MSLNFGNIILTQSRRKEMADKLVNLLKPYMPGMEDYERRFLETLFTKYCTQKQLDWLESLREKYDY